MRYKYLVKQKPYCCGPACVQMIFARRGFVPDSEEAIGNELGLVVPQEFAHHFEKVVVGEPHASGYGTAINKPEYSLNNHFKRHGIALRTMDILPRTLENARIMILDFLRADADIIACVDVDTFYSNGIRAGHFVLIEDFLKIDGGIELVGIVDPGDGLRSVVSLQHLVRAMNVNRPSWEGGLYIIAEPEVLGLRPLV